MPIPPGRGGNFRRGRVPRKRLPRETPRVSFVSPISAAPQNLPQSLTQRLVKAWHGSTAHYHFHRLPETHQLVAGKLLAYFVFDKRIADADINVQNVREYYAVQKGPGGRPLGLSTAEVGKGLCTLLKYERKKHLAGIMPGQFGKMEEFIEETVNSGWRNEGAIADFLEGVGVKTRQPTLPLVMEFEIYRRKKAEGLPMS